MDEDDSKKQIGVLAQFKKDRAATIEPRRSILYTLNDCEMELVEEKEIVGSCVETIELIMDKHYRLGIKEVNTKTIINNAYEYNKTPQKTVHNTLGIMVNSRKICRPRKGVYKLPDSAIQKIKNNFPTDNIGN